MDQERSSKRASPDGLAELRDPSFDRSGICRVHLCGISHEGTICDESTDEVLYLARSASDLPAIIGILVSSIDRIEWRMR